MRLIDGDALMEAMYHRAFETDGDTMWQSGCWVRYRAIEQTVKEQPTITPERKRGRWHGRIYSRDETMVCSECHAEFSYDAETDIRDFNYCPNCGAEMKEGEDV